jgi:HK97 family phage major capsid protein
MHGKIKAFTGPGAEQRAERAGHWAKSLAGIDQSRDWCAKNGVTLVKAQSETIGTLGGFLVPPGFDDAIIAVRDTVGAFRNAEVRPASSDNTVRPRRTGGLTANFVAEGSPIPESSIQFDAVSTTLKKLAILTRSSSELFEDSAPDLAEFLATEIGYAFAAVEDDCGFSGDGTSGYGGIAGLSMKLTGTKSAITAASGHNTFLTLDTTDLADLMGGVLATGIPGAAWYMSAVGYAQCLCRIAATAGGLVATQAADGTIKANFLGFPVRFSSKLPNVSTTLSGKPMMYFGDLSKSSVIAEHRTGTVVSMSRERAFDLDQVLLRGTRREDIINLSVGDITTLGPIAMLVGS